MGRVVIAAFRPKEGQQEELEAVVRAHLPTLRRQGLVTDREAILMRAADGTVIEVFEWASSDAIDAAHEDPVVRELWARFAACCDYVPVGQVPEAAGLFSEFTPL